MLFVKKDFIKISAIIFTPLTSAPPHSAVQQASVPREQSSALRFCALGAFGGLLPFFAESRKTRFRIREALLHGA